MVGVDTVEAVGYEVPDGEQSNGVGMRAVVVTAGDLVVCVQTPAGEAMTREQMDALAQTAVDKLME